jgi:hypothetical protein
MEKTLHIQTTSARRLKVDILSLKGDVVFSRESRINLRNGKLELSLMGLPSGLYFLKLYSNNRIQTGKISRL